MEYPIRYRISDSTTESVTARDLEVVLQALTGRPMEAVDIEAVESALDLERMSRVDIPHQL
ncbi:hypothetical protein [Rhodococcus pyridinivorans]|uniref:hypothetical protein n=1 Tax=Rhodococcus pyridinivorans TaxID=103816 RepID=UPI002078FC75|nr:hypothetical protein [Rhodococcus pyridinivorans]USI89925.1 hypothetical protein LLA01_20625 [Rhodococcus pyridinivorans]